MVYFVIFSLYHNTCKRQFHLFHFVLIPYRNKLNGMSRRWAYFFAFGEK